MMTIRRKVVTEEDRYGGYAMRPTTTVAPEQKEETYHTFSFDTRYAPVANEQITEAPVETRREEAYAPVQTRREEAYAPTQTRREESVIQYSTRPYTTDMQRTVAPAPVRQEKKARKDVMFEIRQPAPVEAEEPRAKVSNRMKVYLGVYLTVAAILAILVIATGLAVSNISADADRLQSEIAVQNEVLAAQNAEILRLTDIDRITGKAVNNGMEKMENAKEVDLLPTSDPMVYEGRTNWFDRFCDWLSKIIGG